MTRPVSQGIYLVDQACLSRKTGVRSHYQFSMTRFPRHFDRHRFRRPRMPDNQTTEMHPPRVITPDQRHLLEDVNVTIAQYAERFQSLKDDKARAAILSIIQRLHHVARSLSDPKDDGEYY